MSSSKDEATYNSLVKQLKRIEFGSEILKKSDKITVIFEGYEIDCCKVALEQSDFFTSLFGNPKAAFSETSRGEVILKHEQVNLDSLAKVLEFMYDTYDEHVDEHGNDITNYAEKKLELFLNLQNFQSIFIVAHFLQVKRVVDICCKFIMEKSDVTNVFDVFDLAQTFDLKNISDFVKLFFGFHFVRIIATDHFLNASGDVIAQILSLEQMKIESEDIALKALSDWMSYKELKFKKARQTDLLNTLLPHIRKDQVSEGAQNRFLKKKWVTDKEWDLVTFSSTKRFWPKMLMVTKIPHDGIDEREENSFSSDESNNYLDDLWSGANQIPHLFWNFSVKDLQTNSWIDCPLKPFSICHSSKQDTIAGYWDNIFIVSILQTFEDDTTQPNVRINYINVEKNDWKELLPKFPHQLKCVIKAVFGDNILFIIGRTPMDCNIVGFMINFNEIEPEWRGFPIPIDNLRSLVYDVLYSPGNVWIITNFRRERTLETGNRININAVFIPEHLEDSFRYKFSLKKAELPGFCLWNNKIIAAGGDMASKSCYLFGNKEQVYSYDKLAYLNNGRASPAMVSDSGNIYVVGGNGFFWHGNEDSVEMYDEKTKAWIVDKDAPKFDKGAYNALIVNKPIRMFLGN